MRLIAAQCGEYLSDAEVRLMFVESKYMMGRYTPTVLDIDLGKGFIRELEKYGRNFHRGIS